MLDVNMQIWNGDDVVNAGDSTARECCWGVCNMNLGEREEEEGKGKEELGAKFSHES